MSCSAVTKVVCFCSVTLYKTSHNVRGKFLTTTHGTSSNPKAHSSTVTGVLSIKALISS